MKKIITAIGSEKLNKKLKEKDQIQIVSKDIQYREGIIEFLEINSEVDEILISERIWGEITWEELVEKILQINPKIEIVLLVQNMMKFQLKDLSPEISKKVKIRNEEAITEYIQEKEETKKLIKQKDNEIKKQKESKVITVLGSGGVGKTSFIIFFIQKINSNKKILIIDFDLIHPCIHIFLNQKRNSRREKEDKRKFILKIKKNVELLSDSKSFFRLFNEPAQKEFVIKFLNLINEYDFIIIDISNEYLSIYGKEILLQSDELIMVIEPDLLGIKKANDLLQIYREKMRLEMKKFSLVFNKYQVTSIHYQLIKNIFSDYRILGRIKQKKKESTIRKVTHRKIRCFKEEEGDIFNKLIENNK